VPDDLEAVPVGVERRPRLDGLRLDPADGHAAHLGLGRDVVDQRRDFVLLGHEAAHHPEQRRVLLDLAAQVLHRAARESDFACAITASMLAISVWMDWISSPSASPSSSRKRSRARPCRW